MKRTAFIILWVSLVLAGLFLWTQLQFLQLAYPAYLWGLLSVLPLTFLVRKAFKKRQYALNTWMDPFLQKRFGLHSRSVLFGLRSFCFLGLLVCVLMALARPQGNETLSTTTGQGIDILAAIDISDSSLAVDVIPNRLEATKGYIRDLLQFLASDRVGLLVFTDDAFPISPFTSDYQALDTLLEEINTKLLPSGGTDFSALFEAAEKRFKSSKDVGKVLLIFSDGENHERDYSEALAPLKEMGVRIYTIGVGTEQGSRIPIPNNTWGSSYKEYEGKEVVTKLNPSVLKDLASQGGGSYFHVNRLQGLIKSLNQARRTLKTRLHKNTQAMTFEEKFPYYLFLGFFFILLERLLFIWENKWQAVLDSVQERIKKMKQPQKKYSFAAILKQVSRKPEIKAWVGAFVLTGAYTLLQGAWYWPFGSYFANQDGKAAFQAQEYEKSAEAFGKGVKKEVENPELLYNQGNALYKAQKYEDALKAYEQALKQPLKTPEERSKALYNQGNAFYRQGQKNGSPQENWENAKKNYEEALTFNSTDKEIQENLDFVKQQLEQLKQQKKNQENQKNKNGKQNQSGKSKNQKNQGKPQNQGSQKKPGEGQSQKKQPRKNNSDQHTNKRLDKYLEDMKANEKQQRGNFQRFKPRHRKKDLHNMTPQELLKLSPQELREMMTNNSEKSQGSGEKNW